MSETKGPQKTKSQRVETGGKKKKKARGRAFAKGVSGNPAGRPPGSRNKATVLALELLEGEAEAVARKAIERALEGDSAALRLCLERLIPLRKDRVITLDLPPITSTQDLATVLAAVVAALAKGEVTPDEAQRDEQS